MSSQPARALPAPDALKRYADGFNQTATLRHFGIVLDFPASDRLRATLEVRPEHRGGLGTEAVNGGILAAMFDLVLGSTSALLDPTRRSATAQISMSFERPVLGDRCTAEAWVDRAGSTMAFSSAVILNGQGEVCARAQGVVRLSSRPWSADGHPGVN